MRNMEENKKSFADKYPRINFLLGLFMIVAIVILFICGIKLITIEIGKGIIASADFLKKFVNNTDKVIIVAMITGAVSIVGVLFTSVIAKIIDYKYNVKIYLYDKREEPYEQFISMVYTIMEDTKKPEGKRMTEEELMKIVLQFSKGLTLWGSNRVVKKWNKYRIASANPENRENLFLLEDIIYEIRKDVGQRRKMKKGDILSLFINDIDKLLHK